jgi:4-methyl-5(b-hydroxyethyl)-thiazole monophosphate biosynthesis
MGAMTDKQTILVPLAEGFEEIETAAIVDVLRRAELHVTLAGLRPGPVLGAHGMAFGTDAELDDVDPEAVLAIVLPGGQPGTDNLMADERILSLCRGLGERKRHTAAICAAPMVLAKAGLLEGRQATSYPSVRNHLAGAEVLEGPRVVRSGLVLTSQGPGTALEFALALVGELKGEKAAEELGRELLVALPAR